MLFGVRDDALSQLDRLEAELPSLFDNYLRLDHLDTANAREAIERPLLRYNASLPPDEHVTIEPLLVEELLGQLRTGCVSVVDAGRGSVDDGAPTIETPILQLVMTRLWSAETERGSRVLRRTTLDELGGAERIVRSHLDGVMAELTEEQQEVAAHLFRHLVTPSGMKIAHTSSDLADYAGLPDAARLTDVLERLASGHDRVLRPVPPPVGDLGPPRYEIFHDVMAPAVLDWRRRYVGERERRVSERKLIEARERAEEEHRRTHRQLKRSRLFSAALVLLLLVVTGLGWYAMRTSDESQHREQLALYTQELRTDPAAALHAAIQAWGKRHSPAGKEAVRTALDADTERSVMRGHTGHLVTSEFSPDGATVLTAGTDGTARSYDADTGHQLNTFLPTDGDRHPLTTASFSGDGALVATAAANGEARVCEAASGLEIAKLREYSLFAYASWGAVDGVPVVLLWSWDARPATLWDPRKPEPIATYGTAETGAAHAAFSRDGRQVATVGTDAVVTVWDTRTGEALARSPVVGPEAGLPAFVKDDSSRLAFVSRYDYGLWQLVFWDWRTSDTPHETGWAVRQIAELTVSEDGSHLAVAGDKQAAVFDTAKRDGVGGTPVLADLVNAVDVSADGRWLATAGNDGRTDVWINPEYPSAPAARLLGHRGGVADVRFHPESPWRLTTAGFDGSARTWQVADRTVLPGKFGWMIDAQLSVDGVHLLTVEDTGHLRVYNVDDGQMVRESTRRVDYFEGWLQKAAFVPDGRRVVYISSRSGAPSVWTWESEDEPAALADSGFVLTDVAVSPDGRTVAAGDAVNRVVCWDLASRNIVARLGAPANGYRVTAVEYIPHTSLLAAASTDGTIRLWDTRQPDRPPRTLGKQRSAPLRALAVTSDGTYVLGVGEDHTIRIWRASDGGLEQTILGPPSTNASVAFDPDGRLLALGAADAAVHIWDWRVNEKLAVLHRHSGAVNEVNFLPDGRLITASDDSTAAIFPCTTCGSFDGLLEQARRRDGDFTDAMQG